MGAVLSSGKTKGQREREKWRRHVARQYDGGHHKTAGIRYRRPYLAPERIEDRMAELEKVEGQEKKLRYMNIYGENDHEKYPDLDTYYSTTKDIPRRLVVQATPEAQKDTRDRHWGHSKINGNIPFVVRLAEFCLNPFRFERYDGGFVDEDDEKAEEIRRKKMSVGCRIVQTTVHLIASTICTLAFAWIIQLMLSFQVITAPWNDSGAADSYDFYENVHWEWPRHAVNMLDQSPENTKPQTTVTKLMIPRRLVVKDESTGKWVVRKTDNLRDKHTGMLQPYVFLSFSRANFPKVRDEELRPFFYRVAEGVLKYENELRDARDPPVEAFWVDMDCVASEPPTVVQNGVKRNIIISPDSEMTKDINSICDAVRCAKRVYVVLPSDDSESKRTWGQRIWTLPEVLLAAEKTRYCISPFTATPEDHEMQINNVLLTDMYHSFWAGHPSRYHLTGHEEDHEDAITHLVNHYTNKTKLSELQLFTFAIQALAQLTSGSGTRGESTVELAYAAMGLLAYRLTPDIDEDVFQAVARLSLVNDSNQLLERLLCLWPGYGDPEEQRQLQAAGGYKLASSDKLLRNIADRDQYSVHLWDINPLCDVVGIGNDPFTPTVITDRCRGIPIRWKKFPRMRYAQDLASFRTTLSQTVVYVGAWFFLTALGLLSTAVSFAMANNTSSSRDLKISVGSYLYGTAIYVGVGWAISWFSPLAVRQLCHGGSSRVACHLVGFEGTMTLREIEKEIYGNYNARLSYAASSSIFSKSLRHRSLRVGIEPRDEDGEPMGSHYWKEQRTKLNIPKSHRLFTIVDTGDMTVTVIAAERPPVVALICGREGGMVRSLLCSWRFETNCLYRECVVRMRSSLEDQATPNDWLKISLASQGEVSETRRLFQEKEFPLPPQSVKVPAVHSVTA